MNIRPENKYFCSVTNYLANMNTGNSLEIMKSLRKEKGLSQTEIAVKMWGISEEDEQAKSNGKNRYSKIERGYSELTMTEVFAFCEAINISPLFLYEGPKSLDQLIQLLNHWKSNKQTNQTNS